MRAATVADVIADSDVLSFVIKCFVFPNMHPLNKPEQMIAGASQKFDAEGNLTDEKAKEMVGRLLMALADWTRKLG